MAGWDDTLILKIRKGKYTTFSAPVRPERGDNMAKLHDGYCGDLRKYFDGLSDADYAKEIQCEAVQKLLKFINYERKCSNGSEN